MAKRNNSLDNDGIELGSELSSNRTVTKQFLLSRRTDWPTDSEGKAIELRFEVVIDLNGIQFNEVLDDAIRTKVITLQNALRGTGKNLTPFEVLKEMSKETLRRGYNNCGATPENPEKATKQIMDAFSNLTPEMKKMLMKQLQQTA